MKKLFFIVVVLLLSNVNAPISAQDNSDEWQKGYIILKNRKDTVRGYLNIKAKSFGFIEQILFRENKDIGKGTLKIPTPMPLYGYPIYKDTLAYFGITNKRYKYISYIDKAFPKRQFLLYNIQPTTKLTEWMEIIEEGQINIYRGFSFYMTS